MPCKVVQCSSTPPNVTQDAVLSQVGFVECGWIWRS